MEYSVFESFVDLPIDAQELAVVYRDINPFVCDLWLRRYEEFLLQGDDKPVYIVAHEANVTHVVLPLLLTRHERLRFRKLRSMANFYTTVFEALQRPEANCPAAARAITDCLLKEFGSVPVLEFEPLRESGLLQFMTTEYGQVTGCQAEKYVKHINRYERVTNDTFESYLARRPGNLRSTLKRKRKQIEKTGVSEIDIFETRAEVREAYPKFRTVYEQSWKGQESFPDFIGAIVADLAEAGKARLGLVSVEGEPAAAQIWFRLGESWGVFKLAYQPQYRQFSVGTLLTAAMIENFFATGPVSVIDFFSGDDAYKKDWVSESREHFGLEFLQTGNLVGKLLQIKRKFS